MDRYGQGGLGYDWRPEDRIDLIKSKGKDTWEMVKKTISDARKSILADVNQVRNQLDHLTAVRRLKNISMIFFRPASRH
jgi:hypothetical protein